MIEIGQDGHPALGQADRAGILTFRRQSPDLGDWRVPLTQQNDLSRGEPFEVAGEVGFGLVDIESNHDYKMNYEVN